MAKLIQFANNAYSTLSGAITNVATTITVQTGEGARFPTITGSQYFYATLIDASNNIEIVKVTARSTDTLTVTRGQDGTTGRAYSSGDRIELRITSGGLTDIINTYPDNIVGTLTNKTTPVDADVVLIEDSAASGAAKYSTFTQMWANYFQAKALAGGTYTGAINFAATQTIASATTTDIGAATSNSVIISGTTTITGLGTVAAGVTREVLFSGALTLTHNATSLILPGSANITTAANDTATFRSLGSGNWVCLSYDRADGTPVVGGGMTLLGTLTTTSGTTQSLTDIAAGYRALYIEVEGVSYSTSGAGTFLKLATSVNNGSSYGTATAISSNLTAAANTWDGTCWLEGISTTNTNAKFARPAIRESGGTIYSTVTLVPSTTSGAINAIRFSGATFDAGTIRVYGVK